MTLSYSWATGRSKTEHIPISRNSESTWKSSVANNSTGAVMTEISRRNKIALRILTIVTVVLWPLYALGGLFVAGMASDSPGPVKAIFFGMLLYLAVPWISLPWARWGVADQNKRMAVTGIALTLLWIATPAGLLAPSAYQSELYNHPGSWLDTRFKISDADRAEYRINRSIHSLFFEIPRQTHLLPDATNKLRYFIPSAYVNLIPLQPPQVKLEPEEECGGLIDKIDIAAAIKASPDQLKPVFAFTPTTDNSAYISKDKSWLADCIRGTCLIAVLQKEGTLHYGLALDDLCQAPTVTRKITALVVSWIR